MELQKMKRWKSQTEEEMTILRKERDDISDKMDTLKERHRRDLTDTQKQLHAQVQVLEEQNAKLQRSRKRPKRIAKLGNLRSSRESGVGLVSAKERALYNQLTKDKEEMASKLAAQERECARLRGALQEVREHAMRRRSSSRDPESPARGKLSRSRVTSGSGMSISEVNLSSHTRGGSHRGSK